MGWIESLLRPSFEGEGLLSLAAPPGVSDSGTTKGEGRGYAASAFALFAGDVGVAGHIAVRTRHRIVAVIDLIAIARS